MRGNQGLGARVEEEPEKALSSWDLLGCVPAEEAPEFLPNLIEWTTGTTKVVFYNSTKRCTAGCGVRLKMREQENKIVLEGSQVGSCRHHRIPAGGSRNDLQPQA